MCNDVAIPRLWGVSKKKIQFLFHFKDTLLFVLCQGPLSFNECMVALHQLIPEQHGEELH